MFADYDRVSTVSLWLCSASGSASDTYEYIIMSIKKICMLYKQQLGRWLACAVSYLDIMSI